MSKSDHHTMSIGAVAKLTGIPADTIRTWERRYDVVIPARTPTGRRTYSTEDVERLSTIARLSEQGERVAHLATLSAQELQERAAMHVDLKPTMPERIQVAAVHPISPLQLGGGVPGAPTRIEVVRAVERPEALEDMKSVDVLVVDLNVLGTEPARALGRLQRRTHPRVTLVTYSFASRAVRARIQAMGARLVQGPTPPDQLRRILWDALAVAPAMDEPTRGASVPAPMFDRGRLERLLHVTPNVACECPNHLASLAIAMREFELYSLRCESETAEDALLHAQLAKATGQMRAELEQLLVRVCTHDGIAL